MDNRPIGIFDSGVGGLTVVKEVMKQLPNESIVYFGDTARVPYGNKSKATVTKFSAQIIKFLRTQHIKAIIIACNTVNSNCIEQLREMFGNLIIEGVVEAGVKMAVDTTKNGRIGVIGTEATIASKRYTQLINEVNPSFKVYDKACPLFVPLVEDGWIDEEVTRLVITKYLEPLTTNDIDTLILGCTHYPMLQQTIQSIVGDTIELINPANEAAYAMGELLKQRNLQAQGTATYEFYVSDHAQRMKQMAQMFLGHPIDEVTRVDIELYSEK
ncbi:MAG: glutamate racemase [Epulopiscium sp. Nuni2H_MBin001]|nr:MAG: glutamate racemase [Epulopiscium sp. Nuni2H_MBin001]